MQLSNQEDSPETAVRPRRSVLRRLLALGLLMLLLLIALFCWRPWQPRIHLVTSINPKDGASMVWVPAGNFRMGDVISSEDIRYTFRTEGWKGGVNMLKKSMQGKLYTYSDSPPHTVYLDGYWIYTYEVTVAQYRRFCVATKRAMPPAPDWGWQDTHPMVNVTWDDASAYASWAGAKLPSEAQWEKAARGTDGRVYPWGNRYDASKCCNYYNSNGSTSPVGSRPAGASPYGCQDMAGNVWEWCTDWYAPYPSKPMRNPTGPPAGKTRMLRGGCWGSDFPSDFRASYRLNRGPKGGNNRIGFRCVRRSPGR